MPALLSAEITARSGRDPGELYRDLTRDLGDPVADRVEARRHARAEAEARATVAAADPHHRARRRTHRPRARHARRATARRSAASRSSPPAAGSPRGRPGTEDIYKIYAESFRGEDHLRDPAGRGAGNRRSRVGRAVDSPRRIKESSTCQKSLDQLCIDTMRFLSVDAVQKANSGHPGMPLGAAPMAYVLWTRLLKHNPRNPALVRSRPLRALGRPRLDAALQPAAPDRLRPVARRHQAVPPVGQQDAGAPRARPHAGRGDHHRAARAGLRQRGRHGDRRGAARGALQPSRIRGHRSRHLRDRQRRRPDGRRRVRRRPRSPGTCSSAS